MIDMLEDVVKSSAAPQAADLYLNLLKRALTNTIFEPEPNADD